MLVTHVAIGKYRNASALRNSSGNHLIGGSGSGGSQARDADGAATRSGRAGTVPPGKASQSTLLQMANRAGASKKELESVQGAKEA